MLVSVDDDHYSRTMSQVLCFYTEKMAVSNFLCLWSQGVCASECGLDHSPSECGLVQSAPECGLVLCASECGLAQSECALVHSSSEGEEIQTVLASLWERL